ncbi:MAG: elongation factor 1-beta [Thermofilaceae archaeon]|jgi:elongation factor 1-beta|nr:elongation factor 1-beta [Thermofilum sp.]MCC6059299.1 elongation factor 1-beta [Thermofilum sp.]
MSQVAILVRVLPEDAEIKAEELYRSIASALPDKYKIARYEVEPIAFGLEALLLLVLAPENIEGGTEELEQTLMSVKGVGQVDVLRVSRMS